MTIPRVYITLPSGTTKTIMTRGAVNVGISKINQVTPNANIGSGIARVKTQGINNPTYSMTATFDRVKFSPAYYLQYTDLLDLAAHQYNGTNEATLFVYYGNPPSPELLPAFDKTTAGIPVVLDSASFPINVEQAQNANWQMVNITFVETR